MSDFSFPEKMANASGDENSPSRTYAQEYNQRMGRWCDAAYEEARSKQKTYPEVKEIQNQIDYLCGLQWKESMPSYRSKPVSNDVLANFWETIGLLTDIKPTWKIKALGFDGTYSQTEKILNAMSKGWAKTSQFNRRMAFWTMFAMMTTAPAKLHWDVFAHGDSGDPADADQVLEALPTSSLLRLGVGWDVQADECVIERRKRTLAWIKRRYPRMGKHVRADERSSRYTSDVQAPPTLAPEFFEQLGAPMKRLMGSDPSGSIMSVYPEATTLEYWMKDDSINESRNPVWMGPQGVPWGYWVKPGQRLYPRGRVIVRANNITLYDEPNPYYHRKKPYVLLGLYDVPWQEYAMSVISPWTKQQDIINQMTAGILDCVKKALRPALMAPKSAIHPDAMRQIDASKPNLKVSYNSNAATAPQWSQPPNIGNYPLPILEMIKKDMRRYSGADAMGDAASKKQIPGSDTLDRLTFGKTTNIRMMTGNVETALDEMGMMWTGNALQFYDSGKRIEQLGLGGLTKEDMDDMPSTMIPDGTKPEAFVRQYGFACERGSLLGFERKDKIQVGFALRKNKDLSRDGLYDLLDWNFDRKRNEAELMDEAKQMAAAMAAAGVQPGGKGHK